MSHRPPTLRRRAALALGLVPLAARRAHAAPLAIPDALGRTIALKAPAERIVFGFNYEEYTAIAGPAGWDRVVGFCKATWSDWRPSVFRRNRREAGGAHHPSPGGPMPMHTRRSAMLLPLAAALPARARAAMPPIADAIGRAVTLKGPAERIVLGFNFEEFTAVAGPAGWDRVVGFNRRQWAVNRQSNWRRYQAAIPRLARLADVGANENGTFSVERVLGLQPDLLVTLAYDYAAMAPLMAQIEAAGVPVLVVDYNAQVLARHVAGTLALGRATGNEDRAQALADLYTSEVADIARRVEGTSRPRVYVELGQGGAGVVGNTYNDAMWGRMVELAGGANIAKGRIPPGFAPMSPEYVLAAAPEHVFITASSWAGSPNAVQAGYDVDVGTTRRTLAPYAERPGWAGLPAIQAGELHAVETGLARSLWDWTATQYVAKSLHPAAFGDVDPVANLRRYHERFLPVAFDGTWMARLTPSPA